MPKSPPPAADTRLSRPHPSLPPSSAAPLSLNSDATTQAKLELLRYLSRLIHTASELRDFGEHTQLDLAVQKHLSKASDEINTAIALHLTESA